jgi:hypothetical protein
VWSFEVPPGYREWFDEYERLRGLDLGRNHDGKIHPHPDHERETAWVLYRNAGHLAWLNLVARFLAFVEAT